MKAIYTLLCCFAFTITKANPIYHKLIEVNSYWGAQKDVSAADLNMPSVTTEHDWIRLHLSLVEKTLRQRSTATLSRSQQQLRARCLDDLHTYWKAGAFPINEDYTYRTPIFIDKHDNFCAVGYLVKTSGYEHISRKIAAQSNLAYVREMKYPELTAWAEEHGFTKDELAWIQPAYDYEPKMVAKSIGKGTDGIIYDLLADEVAGILYAAGSFTMADGSLIANNVASITGTVGHYTWRSMGGGIGGVVYTLAMHNGNIYAAGNFSNASGSPANNVAYWDGVSWHAVGCLSGVVKKLAVLNGELYAAGSFSVCGDTASNFAKWNDTGWTAIPGLSGSINTLEPVVGTLLLGGRFSYNGDIVNVIQWQPGTGFHPYDSPISNEVNDFESFNGTMYAACRHISQTDSTLLYQLSQNAWVAIDTDRCAHYYADDTLAINTLHATNGVLKAGGYFQMQWTTLARNMMDVTRGKHGNWALVDSTIHKIISFRDRIVIAGSFRTGGYNSQLNSIGTLPRDPAGTSTIYTTGTAPSYYPNPASSVLHITHDKSINTFTLHDICGRTVLQQQTQNKFLQVQLPKLPPGIYTTELLDTEGRRFTGKLAIE